MAKFSTGLFAGAIIGMAVSMIDKRTVKKAKKMMRTMKNDMSCWW